MALPAVSAEWRTGGSGNQHYGNFSDRNLKSWCDVECKENHYEKRTYLSRRCMVEFGKNGTSKIRLGAERDSLRCPAAVWRTRRALVSRGPVALRGRKLLYNYVPRPRRVFEIRIHRSRGRGIRKRAQGRIRLCVSGDYFASHAHALALAQRR